MRVQLSVAIVIATIMSAPEAVRAQDNPLARYGVADELVLADSGEMPFDGAPPRIDFGRSGPPVSAAFLVVYVVDSTGHVEMPSVSFGNDVPVTFRRATCHALEQVRYRPLRRDGILRRALVIQPIALWRTNTPRPGTVTAEPLRQSIKDGGLVETLSILAKQPHCE